VKQLKPWKIGAIVGGAIGLSKALDWIIAPIIGAIIGAVLIQSIYTFIATSKLKLWHKAGVIGAILGAIYGAVIPIMAMYISLAHDASLGGRPPIIFRPTLFTFSFLITDPTGEYSYRIALLLNWSIWTTINALILYILATTISKTERSEGL